MSADTRTSPPERLLYYTPSDVSALAQQIASPSVLDAFLSVIRARRARLAAQPIPAPAKPIALEIDINPS